MWLAQCSFSPLWERMANRVLHRRRQQIQLSTVVHGRVEKKGERKGNTLTLRRRTGTVFLLRNTVLFRSVSASVLSGREWPPLQG